MTDDTVINGQTVDDFYDTDQNHSAKVTKLSRTIEGLEKEKIELIRENVEMKEELKKLTIEMRDAKYDEEDMKYRLGVMEKEIEQSDEDKKILEQIAKRAVELETDMARLQHDLISAMSEAEEANKELIELKRVLGDEGMKIDGLLMEIEVQRKEKSEKEKIIRELEKKLGVLQFNESEESSKRFRIEEEMSEKIDEKDKSIGELKKKIEELESAIVNCVKELKEWKMKKMFMDEALCQSEEKTRAIELKLLLLQKNAAEAESVVRGLKENTIEAVKEVSGGDGGVKLQWPVLAARSAGIVGVAVAVIYVCFLRKN